MPAPLPKAVLPADHNDLLERFVLIREHIGTALGANTLAGEFDLHKKFQDNTSLRQAAAEILLASVLWTEAGRKTQETLDDCVPALRQAVWYASSCFLEYLQLKALAQKGSILNRGSMADAWIHLLVEFREALADPRQEWVWRQIQTPFVLPEFL